MSIDLFTKSPNATAFVTLDIDRTKFPQLASRAFDVTSPCAHSSNFVRYTRHFLCKLSQLATSPRLWIQLKEDASVNLENQRVQVHKLPVEEILIRQLRREGEMVAVYETVERVDGGR